MLILLALDRKFSFRRGRLFCLYAMYYTLGRVWIEAMRIDDAEQITFFGLTTRLNVWTSIIVFAGALLAFILLGLRKRTEPDTPFLPGRAPAQAPPAEATPVGSTPAEEKAAVSKAAESKPDDDATDADATDDDRATVPADAATIRHSDAAVSDSESRANLRNNQSGPARASEDADKDSTGGTAPAKGAPAAGVSGRQGTGTAPEAEGTK